MTDETKKTSEETKATTEAKAPAKPVTEKPKTTASERPNRPARGRKGRGPRRREPKEFEESILQIDRVTRVNKGGRQMRFRISVVIGDKKGRVGFGIGKSGEVMIGIQKAVAAAKLNLINVPIFNDTIPHAVETKFKASRVLLFPAPEGKGIIAGGSVRKILELSGVKNVLSKMHGSRNRINSAYATMEALRSLQNQAPHGTKVEEEKEETPKAEKVEEKAPEKKLKKKPTAKKVAQKKAA
jgi:small subunit ribosomal protein S5